MAARWYSSLTTNDACDNQNEEGIDQDGDDSMIDHQLSSDIKSSQGLNPTTLANSAVNDTLKRKSRGDQSDEQKATKKQRKAERKKRKVEEKEKRRRSESEIHTKFQTNSEYEKDSKPGRSSFVRSTESPESDNSQDSFKSRSPSKKTENKPRPTTEELLATITKFSQPTKLIQDIKPIVPKSRNNVKDEVIDAKADIDNINNPSNTFPLHYERKKGVEKPYWCPYKTCAKAYSRRHTLCQHLDDKHSDSIAYDNGDGTFKDLTLNKNPTGNLVSSSPELTIKGVSKKCESGSSENEVCGRSSKYQQLQNSSGQGLSRKLKLLNSAAKTITPTKNVFSGNHEKHTASESSVDEPLSRTSRRRAGTGESVLGTTKLGSMKDSPYASSRTTDSPVAKDQMEEWERTTGALTASLLQHSGDDSDVELEIAFSSVRLGTPKGIVAGNISLKLHCLSAGTRHLWEAAEQQERMCSVSAGKLKVKMASETFIVGKNSAWYIPAGQQCLVQNTYYEQAAVHVTTVDAD